MRRMLVAVTFVISFCNFESPVCQSNMKPEGILGPNSCGLPPENFQVSCVISYHGNQPPIIAWKNVGAVGFITEGTSQNISDNQAIYYLEMEVNPAMDGSSYQCQTTRSSTTQFHCTTGIVKVIGSEPSSVAIYGISAMILIIAIIIIAINSIACWCIRVRRVKRKRKIPEMSTKLAPKNDSQECSRLEARPFDLTSEIVDCEPVEALQMEIQRLKATVHELEQRLYRTGYIIWCMAMETTTIGGGNTFLGAVLILMTCVNVGSDLIVKPKDSEVLVGGSTFFNCSTTLTSAEIHWFHYPVGETRDRSFVYGYDQFYSSYLGRFQMEKNIATGVYNLVILVATVDDAGRFECQDDTGRGDKHSAHLIVLDENPVCQSNMKPQGLIGPNICGFEPEELYLTCSVTFHGDQAPVMQWKEAGSDNPIAEGVGRNISSNLAIYYLKMKVSFHADGSSYQCLTTRSTKTQHGCTSDVVNVAGFSRTSAIIVIIVVLLGVIIVAGIVIWIIGRSRLRRQMNVKGSKSNHGHRSTGVESEQFELNKVPGKRDPKASCENDSDSDSVKENMEKLSTENKRLTKKVAELEHLLYSTDDACYSTTTSSANTIHTKAATVEERRAPVTGITIIGNELFVVSKNYPGVEVYDADTFVFADIIQAKEIPNPLDIASAKEIQCLYVINRYVESPSEIIRVSIAGGRGKYWITENDYGRLSTYESNLVVCFSTKRIIVEYSPEGEKISTVRLSPGAGFDQLWHAIKLTGTNFAVSHSKNDSRHRICVVDINGSVLKAFDELPGLMFRMDSPICLLWDRDKSLFVADTNNNRVLLLNSNLIYEDVLLKIDHIPVRLCLNEKKDRVFVGVNRGSKKPDTWCDGRILIYNIEKRK